MREPRFKLRVAALAGLVLALLTAGQSFAQSDADLAAARKKLNGLVAENKYFEALPVAEMLVKAFPDDADVQASYGFCLIAAGRANPDREQGRQMNIKARAAFAAAKKFGSKSTLVDAMLSSLPADGRINDEFSPVPAANRLMNEAEANFAQGKLDDALASYQKALEIDPAIYEAALFSGDVYVRKGDFSNAEIWYQKAIAINPNRETAYRYSATPLMKQSKTAEALDRYIEAFITEPYSKFAVNGMVQWSQVTQTPLGHPRLNIPETKVGADGKPETTISVSTTDDGSMAWIGYSATRAAWQKEKFAKTYPGQAYRHTLAEEAEALRSVILFVNSMKTKPAKLARDIQALIDMDKDGVLEAFILMAIPDEGIARDHAAYLAQNRDKLRLYVKKYVVSR